MARNPEFAQVYCQGANPGPGYVYRLRSSMGGIVLNRSLLMDDNVAQNKQLNLDLRPTGFVANLYKIQHHTNPSPDRVTTP